MTRYLRNVRALLNSMFTLQVMVSSEAFALHSICLPWSAGHRAHGSFAVLGTGNCNSRSGVRCARRSCAPRRGRLRQLHASLAKIPSGSDPYVMLRKQTAQATQDAVKSGIDLIELEFPPVRGKLDISLAETLDANRAFARELARSFSAQMGKTLWLVFPDDAEADGAEKEYGGTTFTVVGIDSAINKLQDQECQMQIVVNPGFNVEEWIVLEKLHRPGVPMVMLNGGLDKLRMGYYPRMFFPGLYNAKERFLKNFKTVYYLKALPGGWIFRQAPGDWQIISASQTEGKNRRAAESRVLESSPDRPDYNRAVKVIQEAAKASQQ